MDALRAREARAKIPSILENIFRFSKFIYYLFLFKSNKTIKKLKINN